MDFGSTSWGFKVPPAARHNENPRPSFFTRRVNVGVFECRRLGTTKSTGMPGSKGVVFAKRSRRGRRVKARQARWTTRFAAELGTVRGGCPEPGARIQARGLPVKGTKHNLHRALPYSVPTATHFQLMRQRAAWIGVATSACSRWRFSLGVDTWIARTVRPARNKYRQN